MFLNCKTNENVMPPEKIQVSARISKELHDKCIQLYDNMTTAIITGLEMACKSNENTCKSNENPCKTDENSNKELSALLEEKDRHIETLKNELGISQETHRNYMLQMQTLINQKAIEAPGEKKKPFWKFW
jgi:uncharacterized protein YpmB